MALASVDARFSGLSTAFIFQSIPILVMARAKIEDFYYSYMGVLPEVFFLEWTIDPWDCPSQRKLLPISETLDKWQCFILLKPAIVF